MSHSNGYQAQQADDTDRRNRFASVQGSDSGPASLRERAASQPPRTSSQNFLSSQQSLSPSLGRGNPPWATSTQRLPSGLNPGSYSGLPPIPVRSSSFSSTAPTLQTSLSAMREARAFASTFEDDESEVSDTYDERFVPPSMPHRGRTYAADLTRSRSQSLATNRVGGVGVFAQPGLGNWNDSSSLSNPLNIPGRYGDIKPPGSSRYGSLGTLGRSPSNNYSSSPVGNSAGNGFSHYSQQVDISNMSPFMRDVGQILLDDGSAFRELWSGMNPPRDENGGGGSGTTSRRHSVSVVQPRRGIIGFNAPGNDAPEEPTRPAIFSQSSFGRGGLLLTDEDLADDLNMLNLGKDGPGPVSSGIPPSQPSSLPIYAPHSRSPPSDDRFSQYQGLNLSIPGGGLSSRQTLGSPSDSGLSTGGSPSMGHHDFHGSEGAFMGSQHQQPQNLTAHFIPGQGIKYVSQQMPNDAHAYGRGSGGLASPVSPNSSRNMQQSMFSSPIQRRPSGSAGPPQHLNELGKGVPLHSVPAACPLYIVEFKAGRTDLFYSTDLSIDIRVGDLVIVEADRGKDLGKVVNDTITLAEVEAFQKQQQARAGYGEQGVPLSPGGTPMGGSKKEINPKLIYGKAGAQDTQLLVTKIQDEVKALQLCQSKVRQKKLPMEVIDAEYQWDRRKLTFYFVAEKRIDFRELVRELFRLYKTRIWMASLQGPGYEQ
ncbi:PSP1-domain-containing protein [Artomyces pyxidatus]|uniref:PSP1-domain-containing protein n=1 Tax=Artomyces pyxidatus TaxID=48021 RepID=A0ACB8T3E7_9AGAM|nr:PSP1-domain-containing protein [Artomyces pyxidatus]